MNEDNQESRKRQEQENHSAYVADRCCQYLLNLLIEVNMHLDRRLVQTLLGLVITIVVHRHRNNGLLLSELGGYLLDPEHAPAGTKRISNLLHSPKWGSNMIETHLWEQADQRVTELNQAGEQVLVVWDESVIEKPESLHLEGLCAVKSSKAKRLKRIKPGYYNPPGGRPIFVPGYNWLQVLVMGMTGPLTVATMHWWSTRGEHASDRRSEEQEVLREVSCRWGADVLHIWDRGFAGNPWLTLAFVHAVRFVLRWPKYFKLLDDKGRPRKPGEISSGKRSWEHRLLWDARRRCNRKTGIIAFQVADPTHHQPLWLVVVRRKGQSPWYLLTCQPIRCPNDAWNIALAYIRRWNVELSIRFDKCELAFESPRLRKWETQLRLLLITTLAYAFLLSLLFVDKVTIVPWLLRNWCHRTGRWRLKVKTPLYRLRSALSRLWLTHPPPFILLLRLNLG